MSVRVDRKKLMTQMIKKDVGVGVLAKRAQVSVSTLSNIRSGKACSLKIAKALAEGLSVSLDSLLQDREAIE